MSDEQKTLRDVWLGALQEHLERFIKQAPDEVCRDFAQDLWNQTATEFPDDDEAALPPVA